ncbi:MAG: hypothetical protein Q9159_003405 [Coniocarpon cinnabarinum]
MARTVSHLYDNDTYKALQQGTILLISIPWGITTNRANLSLNTRPIAYAYTHQGLHVPFIGHSTHSRVIKIHDARDVHRYTMYMNQHSSSQPSTLVNERTQERIPIIPVDTSAKQPAVETHLGSTQAIYEIGERNRNKTDPRTSGMTFKTVNESQAVQSITPLPKRNFSKDRKSFEGRVSLPLNYMEVFVLGIANLMRHQHEWRVGIGENEPSLGVMHEPAEFLSSITTFSRGDWERNRDGPANE